MSLAALLHDIGKLGLPDDVLRKPGPLDDDTAQLVLHEVRRGVGTQFCPVCAAALTRAVEKGLLDDFMPSPEGEATVEAAA